MLAAKPKCRTIAFVVADNLEQNDFHNSLLLLLAACERQGIAPVVIPISRLATSSTPHLPAIKNGAQPVEVDAVVFAVSGGSIATSTAQIESRGIPCLNSASAVLATNKAMSEATAAGIVPSFFPRTFSANSNSGALQCAQDLGYPVIFKRARGKGGLFVEIAKTEDEARLALQRLDADTHGLLVSDYEDCGQLRRRTFAIGGHVLPFAIETTMLDTTVNDGEYAKVRVGALERGVMKAFARATGHGNIAFDYSIVQRASGKPNALEAGSPVFFEGNSVGSLATVQRVTGCDIAGTTIDFLAAKSAHWQLGGRGNPPNWTLPEIATGLDIADGRSLVA